MKAESGDKLPTSSGTASNGPPVSSQASKPRQVADVSIEEFWERMGYRQECTLNAVTGFFVVDSTDSSASPTITATSPPAEDFASTPLTAATETDATSTIPTAMLARISSSLQNLDFATLERARENTRVLTESIKGLSVGLDEGFYDEHVVSIFTVRNPPGVTKMAPSASSTDGPDSSSKVPSSTAPVNVLQVRKKKRPAAVP